MPIKWSLLQSSVRLSNWDGFTGSLEHGFC